MAWYDKENFSAYVKYKEYIAILGLVYYILRQEARHEREQKRYTEFYNTVYIDNTRSDRNLQEAFFMLQGKVIVVHDTIRVADTGGGKQNTTAIERK